MASALGSATRGEASEVARINQTGPLSVKVENQGSDSIAVLFERVGASTRLALSDAESANTQTVSNGESLSEVPVVPGSLQLTGTSLPTVKDPDKDGVLYVDRVDGSLLHLGSEAGTTSVAATRTLTDATQTFSTLGVREGDLVVISDGVDKGNYTVVNRASAHVLTLDRDFPVGSQTSVTYAIYAVKSSVGTVNYNTGLLTLDYPTGDTPSGHATVLGTLAFPLNLSPGATLTVDIDAGGAATATFDAARAVLAGSGGTFAAMAAETFKVQFEDGDVQTVTFTTEATIAAAIVTINSQLVGGHAVLNVNQVDIYSDKYGTDSRVRTSAVAAGVTSKLGIANTADESGTGDVADINAVSTAEAKTVIEADCADTSVTFESNKIRITNTSANVGAASKIQIAGTARTIFGLSGSLILGSAAGSEENLTATWLSTESLGSLQSVVRSVVNLPGDELRVSAVSLGTTSCNVKVSY